MNYAITSAHTLAQFAKPDEVRFAEALPKTRSGKNHAAPFKGNRERRKGHR